jgi:hypothetical protein
MGCFIFTYTTSIMSAFKKQMGSDFFYGYFLCWKNLTKSNASVILLVLIFSKIAINFIWLSRLTEHLQFALYSNNTWKLKFRT